MTYYVWVYTLCHHYITVGPSLDSQVKDNSEETFETITKVWKLNK